MMDAQWIARSDQYRAAATDRLSTQVDAYRAAVEKAGETAAFSILVAQIYKCIDPDDHLDTEASNELIGLAEEYAVAVSRLAAEAAR